MNYVCYYRVSTQKQSISGLGLESQKSIITNFINPDDKIISEFTEIESGKNRNRIELEKAIQLCKKEKAALIVAKLDRLARDVEFLFKIVNTGIDIKFCDMQIMNTLTLGLFATISQYERELISSRTKSALKELKKKGIKLGTNNLSLSGIEKSVNIRKEKAKNDESNKRAFAFIQSLLTQNKSLRQIANQLNESGFKTSKGNQFFANSVKQIITFHQKKTE